MGPLAGGTAGRFGATLRARREAAALTQQQLARQAGLSVGTVRSLEQGRTVRPTAGSADRLAEALGLDAAEAERFRRAAGPAGDAQPAAQETARNGRPGPPGIQGTRTSGVWLRVLGPVEVWQRGRLVPLGAAKHRVVLGVLALAANTSVPRDQIIDALWERDPPASAVNLVQAYVSQLRRVLDPGRPAKDRRGLLQTVGNSYRLQVATAQLDALVFGDLARQGHQDSQAGRYAAACEVFERALALWQGDPLADVDALRGHPAVTALAHGRSAAIAGYARAAVRVGQPERVLPHLRELAHREPLNETAQALLMTALAAAGQQAAALAVFDDVRRRLDEQLGVRPGPELARAQQCVLRPDVPVTAPAPDEGPDEGLAEAPIPRQLPAAVRGFVGREAELAKLSATPRPGTAPGMAVTVIVGTAGIGKTTLALQFAHRVASRFPDGQLYVNLRGFGPAGAPSDPAEAVRVFLSALGVPSAQIPPELDAQTALYRSLLADRRVLIVLDNAHDAAQVRPLLPGSAGSVVVITSRNELTSLVAAEGAQPLLLTFLTEAESRQLLERRLGVMRTSREPGAVDELIRLCARLPLALSVAAARAAAQPALSLGVLAADLRDAHARLDALSTEDAVTDVRAVFSWSYQRLREPVARFFRLLGAHPGPDISLTAAASLAGMPVDVSRAALAELIRAQLLTEHAPGRYTFHDLLRAYATEKACGTDDDAGRRHAVERMLAHYLHTAHAAAVLLYPARDSAFQLSSRDRVATEVFSSSTDAQVWFEAEREVLVSVIALSADLGYHRLTWQISWAITDFLLRYGNWATAAAVERAGLKAAQCLGDPAAEAYFQRVTGRVCLHRGRYEEAERHLMQAVRLNQRIGDDSGQAHCHLSLGRMRDEEGRYAEAADHARQALLLYQRAGHQTGQADSLNAVGWCHVRQRNFSEAIACCQQALALQRELKDQIGEAASLDSLGYAYRHLGQYADAVDRYQQALALRRVLGDQYHQASTQSALGDTYRAAGDIPSARAAWQEALTILDRLQHPRTDEVRGKLQPGGAA